MALINKIILGTRQYNISGVVWLTTRVVKRELAGVMKEAVNDRLLSPTQGQKAAEQILYKNVVVLYK